jgi:hypothetical protein
MAGARPSGLLLPGADEPSSRGAEDREPPGKSPAELRYEAAVAEVADRSPAELEAMVRGLGLLEWRTPVERAKNVIREEAEVLRRLGEGETADKVLAAVGPGRPRGKPRVYGDQENHALVEDLLDIVERQTRPSVASASASLAKREPYRAKGISPAAIRQRYADFCRRYAPGAKPAEFAKLFWQKAREAEGNSGN